VDQKTASDRAIGCGLGSPLRDRANPLVLPLDPREERIGVRTQMDRGTMISSRSQVNTIGSRSVRSCLGRRKIFEIMQFQRLGHFCGL
jgi:hypothetical protein